MRTNDDVWGGIEKKTDWYTHTYTKKKRAKEKKKRAKKRYETIQRKSR